MKTNLKNLLLATAIIAVYLLSACGLHAADGHTFIELKGHVTSVFSAAFSQDGKKIITRDSDKTVRIWDAESGEELQRLEGHADSVLSAAFSPDGKKVVTVGEDKTVRTWDVDSGKELQILEGHTDTVLSAAFSPDGKKVVTVGEDKTVRTWDVDSGKELQKFEGHAFRDAVFSPDGKKVVTVTKPETKTPLIKIESIRDVTIRFWDADSGKESKTLKVYEDDSTLFTGKPIKSVVLSPDGRRVVVIFGIPQGISDHSVIPQSARIWDADSGKALWELGQVDHVVFSQDGKKIAASTISVTKLSFTPTPGTYNHTVRIKNIGSGKESPRLTGHTSRIISSAFSPDGKNIATASRDRTVRIWNADTGKQLEKLEVNTQVEHPLFPSYVNFVAFSPDGKKIITASADHIVRIWTLKSDFNPPPLNINTTFPDSRLPRLLRPLRR